MNWGRWTYLWIWVYNHIQFWFLTHRSGTIGKNMNCAWIKLDSSWSILYIYIHIMSMKLQYVYVVLINRGIYTFIIHRQGRPLENMPASKQQPHNKMARSSMLNIIFLCIYIHYFYLYPYRYLYITYIIWVWFPQTEPFFQARAGGCHHPTSCSMFFIIMFPWKNDGKKQ